MRFLTNIIIGSCLGSIFGYGLSNHIPFIVGVSVIAFVVYIIRILAVDGG
jgi:hypothetical protein